MGFGMVCDCCGVWAGVILVIMVLVSVWFARIGLYYAWVYMVLVVFWVDIICLSGLRVGCML